MVLAVILGSSFSKTIPEGLDLRPLTVKTTRGPFVVYVHDKSRTVFVFRHGLPYEHLPHQIPWRRLALALRAVGVSHVVITSNVGVLDAHIPLFKPLLVDDVLCLASVLPDGSPFTMWPHADDRDAGHLVVQQKCGLFDPVLRDVVTQAFSITAQPVIFGYVPGPRTKTPAESRAWARLGAQVNSMTVAPECVLLAELGIATAAVVVGHVSATTPAFDEETVAASLKSARLGLEEGLRALLSRAEQGEFVRRPPPAEIIRFPVYEDPEAEAKKLLRAAAPGQFTLSSAESACAGLQKYMLGRGWLCAGEQIIALSIPGDGNMNCTVRVHLNSGSTTIVKQSPAFVFKYPSIPAPQERLAVEYLWYQIARTHSALRQFLPEVYDLDRRNFICHMEDLGISCADMTTLYTKDSPGLPGTKLARLCGFLISLHSIPVPTDSERSALLLNRKMRALNAEHIFRFPLLENTGVDLESITPGLGAVASRLRADGRLCAAIHALSALYLPRSAKLDTLPTASEPPGRIVQLVSDARHRPVVLLHGDFFPGSWMSVVDDEVKVIDPEFAFCGLREFDLGVMVGHLKLSRHSSRTTNSVLDLYGACDVELVKCFAAVEVIRRLIGLAQLGRVDMDLEEKLALLQWAQAELVR